MAILCEFAGIPIPEQSVTWIQKTGTHPYTTSISVPLPIAEKILQTSNPVTLKVSKYDTQIGNDDISNTIEVKNLYIIDHYIHSEFNVTINFCDCRWLFQGKKLRCAYNVTYLKNDTTPIVNTTHSPLDIQKQMQLFSSGRYAPYSVKGIQKDKTKTSEVELLPYTIKEIIELELANNGLDVVTSISPDLSYIVDNVEYDGIDLAQGLSELLRLGRLSLGVTLDGKMYVFSLTSTENTLFGDPIATLGSSLHQLEGGLHTTNKRRARPRSVKIRFPRKEEIMLFACDYEPLTFGKQPGVIPQKYYTAKFLDDTAHIFRRAIACYNVIPMIYEETYNGEIYYPGKYVPMEIFLSIYGLSLSDITARPGYFSENVFRNQIMVKSGFEENPLNLQRATAISNNIYQHFRQTYMIDPFYIPEIRSWETRLCSVINNFDHKTMPSTVYTDYCHLGFARSSTLFNITPYKYDWWTHCSFNYDVLVNDPDTDFPTAVTPGVANVVDERLGIFRIDFPSVTTKIVPTKVGPKAPVPTAQNQTIALIQTYPTPDHSMATVVSMVFRTDYNSIVDSHKRFWSIEFFEDGINLPLPMDLDEPPTPPTSTAQFDTWEIIADHDVARYRYIRPVDVSKSATTDETKSALFKDMYYPMNEPFLTLAANYEAALLYNTFADRVVGTLTLPYLESKVGVVGNLATVTWMISPSGTKTIYDFVDYIPFPSLDSSLPQKYVDYLRQNVHKSDDASSPHKAI